LCARGKMARCVHGAPPCAACQQANMDTVIDAVPAASEVEQLLNEEHNRITTELVNVYGELKDERTAHRNLTNYNEWLRAENMRLRQENEMSRNALEQNRNLREELAVLREQRAAHENESLNAERDLRFSTGALANALVHMFRTTPEAFAPWGGVGEGPRASTAMCSLAMEFWHLVWDERAQQRLRRALMVAAGNEDEVEQIEYAVNIVCECLMGEVV